MNLTILDKNDEVLFDSVSVSSGVIVHKSIEIVEGDHSDMVLKIPSIESNTGVKISTLTNGSR